MFHATWSEECEAWAILKGMEWAWNRNVRGLQVHSDADNVVRWINGEESPDGLINLFASRCRR